MAKREVFILNGYRLIYEPQHHRAIKRGGYRGYVYEHIFVAEKFLKRKLRNNEVVHHLDNNRANNRRENLLVLEDSQHAKLHAWLAASAPSLERGWLDRVNSVKSKVNQPTYCQVCDRTLQIKQKKFCSIVCASSTRISATRPSKDDLETDMESMSWVGMGHKYGVTDNAVRKWAKSYGLL